MNCTCNASATGLRFISYSSQLKPPLDKEGSIVGCPGGTGSYASCGATAWEGDSRVGVVVDTHLMVLGLVRKESPVTLTSRALRNMVTMGKPVGPVVGIPLPIMCQTNVMANLVSKGENPLGAGFLSD